MDVLPGMRVVRGPNWKWGEQDGGEGGVGTVVDFIALEEAEGGVDLQRAVVVQWDSGNRCNYRSAIGGHYDLLLLDNGPVGRKHPDIVCEVCRDGEITGMRWKCAKCPNTNLCSRCYNEGNHALDHDFVRIISPDGPRVRMSCRRSDGHQIMSMGMFPGADVARGHDWLWGDQDGGLGKTGNLKSIRGWENDNSRSIAEVEWRETRKRNVYRVGHKGKVDLRCVTPANGGYYYVNHLPMLGAPLEFTLPPESEIEEKPIFAPLSSSTVSNDASPTSEPVAHMASSTGQHAFAPGDNVRVELDVEIFKMMQEGHGECEEELLESLSDVGTVHSVLDNGDVRVKYPDSKIYTVNRNAISKVTHFSAGDVIRIIDDIATVHNLQESHGGWVDDMALSLGQVGRVVKVFPTGDVRVVVNARTWTYNPQCLSHAPGENVPEAPPELPEQDGEDLGLHLKLLSLLDNPAVIVAAAASGDVATLQEFLRKHPTQVINLHTVTLIGEPKKLPY